MPNSSHNASGLLVSFAVAAACVHCSSDDERPPPYARPALDDPKGCLDLRTSGKLIEGEFRIDGKRANCAAEGLECALDGAPEVVGSCDGGVSSAVCASNIWRFRCDALGDAGIDGAP